MLIPDYVRMFIQFRLQPLQLDLITALVWTVMPTLRPYSICPFTRNIFFVMIKLVVCFFSVIFLAFNLNN